MTPATRLMVARLTTVASRGLNYQEAAVETGFDYQYIAAFACRHNIQFVLRKRGRPFGSGSKGPGERERDMLKRYTAGETLKSIGDSYKITRERVRQLLTKHYNLRARDGGQAEQTRQKVKLLRKQRDTRAMKVYGCSYREYRRLQKVMGKPTYAYVQQRKNARIRNIEWHLSLWQWWKFWEQSGHWAERGRGRGYCMCRLNDNGPYSVDNVYIATGVENIQDYWASVKDGTRTRPVMRPRAKKNCAESMRAATARYRLTPKFKLRYELRRQGVPKEQRDAIVSQTFGAKTRSGSSACNSQAEASFAAITCNPQSQAAAGEVIHSRSGV